MEAVGLVCLLSITAVDDIKSRQVRVLEIIFFGLIGIIFNMIRKPHSLPSVLGGVMVGTLVYIFSILSKEKIGRGDGLVLMAVGIYLGFADTLELLWVSTILAAIIGTIFVKKHKANMDIELPFVPFLLMGYLLLFAFKELGGFVVCG